MKHKIFEVFLRNLESHKCNSEKTEIEQYHIDCWSTCKAIETSLKKLNIAEESIRQSYRYCPNDSEIAEYIEFHIENYLIRSRSIYDRVLIFTNYLCDIQMAKESVSHTTIITNRKVEKSGLKNALKKINKACEEYRILRNGVVHHGKYSDPELVWVDTARKAKFILDGKIEKIGISDEQILEATASLIVNHLNEFKANTQSIKDSVNSFLDKAISIYEKRTQKT